MRRLLLVVVLGVSACGAHDPLGVYRQPDTLLRDRAPSGAGDSADVKRPAVGASGTAAAAPGQVLPAGGEWTLAGCIDQALRQSPKTRSTYLAALAAAAGVGEAKASYLPTADLSGGVDVGGNLRSDLPTSDPSASFTGRFTLRYVLFDATRGGRLDSAEAQLEAADFRHHASLLDLALEVQEAFAGLQGALWYQEAVEELVKQGESQYNLAKARFDVGLARRYDVVQAEAQLAELLAMRVTARSQVVQAQGQLAKSMGLRASTKLTVARLPETDPAMPAEDVERLMALAVESRPELGEAQAKVRAAMAAAKVADAGYLPTVSADASVAGSSNSDSGLSIPWSVGVGVTVPLFSGFETHYASQRAGFDEEQARSDLEGLVNDVQFEVWAAYSVALQAKEQVAALEKMLVATQESVKLAEENYSSGVGTVVEVLNAQGSLASARLKLVQARLDWNLALARIERAVGKALVATPSISGDMR